MTLFTHLQMTGFQLHIFIELCFFMYISHEGIESISKVIKSPNAWGRDRIYALLKGYQRRGGEPFFLPGAAQWS